MPELPEVETTCLGIRPHLVGSCIEVVEVRETRLRVPVPESLGLLGGCRIHGVSRRAKYILIGCDGGTVIIHLGMSGSLRICEIEVGLRKHDHVIFLLDSGKQMRFHDPRRFGVVDFTIGDPGEHVLLAGLGPEPLGDGFDVEYLVAACEGRGLPIKSLVMSNRVVVGVGNIYACEALYMAGIHPMRAAGRISRVRLGLLVGAIRNCLEEAIRSGGTTLRDFVREDGRPGYFKQKLQVYDRAGEPCRECGAGIRKVVLAGRSTYYCPVCQR